MIQTELLVTLPSCDNTQMYYLISNWLRRGVMVRRSRYNYAFVLLVALTLVMALLPISVLAEPDMEEGEGLADDTVAMPLDETDEQVVEDASLLETQDEIQSDAPTDDTLDVSDEDQADTEIVELTEMSEQGISVAVTKTQVIVTVSGVAGTGSAALRAFAANEYPASDGLHGYSGNTASSGRFVGDYVCGSSQEFTFERFAPDG